MSAPSTSFHLPVSLLLVRAESQISLVSYNAVKRPIPQQLQEDDQANVLKRLRNADDH